MKNLDKPLNKVFSYYPLTDILLTQKDETSQGKLEDFAAKHGSLKIYKDLVKIGDDLIDKSVLIGVEVEVEGVLDPKKASYSPPGWTTISDHSLRNSGVEYVSLPMRGSQLKFALAGLHAHLMSFSPAVDFSWRTGFHFHLNMREETQECLVNMLILYLLFEDSLFTFVGEKRRQANFCVPLQDTDFCEDFSELLNGNKTLSRFILNCQKYSALNIRPLNINDHSGGGDGTNIGGGAGKGTIEFRHLPGSAPFDKQINWINLSLRLLHFARGIQLDALEEIVSNINNYPSYINLAEEVFNDHKKYLKIKNFDEILANSITSAKECFFPVPDIGKLLKEVKPESSGLEAMIDLRTR